MKNLFFLSLTLTLTLNLKAAIYCDWSSEVMPDMIHCQDLPNEEEDFANNPTEGCFYIPMATCECSPPQVATVRNVSSLYSFLYAI